METERGRLRVENHTLWPQNISRGLERWRLAARQTRSLVFTQCLRTLFQVSWQRLIRAWTEGRSSPIPARRIKAAGNLDNSETEISRWMTTAANYRRIRPNPAAHHQDEGLWAARVRSKRPRIWLTRSACPLVCGWNPDDRLTVAPICRQNSLQNWETNWGPLMSVGSPWTLKTWSNTARAVSLAAGSFGRGIKRAVLEKRSTTVSTLPNYLRGRQTRNEIQSDVRPRTRWNGERAKQPSGGGGDY